MSLHMLRTLFPNLPPAAIWFWLERRSEGSHIPTVEMIWMLKKNQ